MKRVRIILSCLVMLFAQHGMAADTTCEACNKVGGLPSVDKTVLALASIDPTPSKKEESSFDSYLEYYCLHITQIEPSALQKMIRDMSKESSYPIDNFFQKNGCSTINYGGGVKSPIIHLAADNPCYRSEFPEIINKYYTVKRKDPSLWLAAINAKNSLGETFLDYIESMFSKEKYTLPETKQCANNLIAFACSTGAVYSKYAGKKCP